MLHSELKEFVPITARTMTFHLKKGKSTVIGERKQFPLILDRTFIVQKPPMKYSELH